MESEHDHNRENLKYPNEKWHSRVVDELGRRVEDLLSPRWSPASVAWSMEAVAQRYHSMRARMASWRWVPEIRCWSMLKKLLRYQVVVFGARIRGHRRRHGGRGGQPSVLSERRPVGTTAMRAHWSRIAFAAATAAMSARRGGAGGAHHRIHHLLHLKYF